MIASIPILFESGIQTLYDAVWVVYATPEQQLERLIQRSEKNQRPLTPEQAQLRIDQQMPLAEKAKAADVVIDNSGTLASATAQVDEQLARLVVRA